MKDFPSALLNEILQRLENLAALHGPGLVAAFDADGTLWSNDMGEQFFEYQIQSGKLDLPSDPWAHYEGLKVNATPQAAYLWLAQINKGQKIETVRSWAADCVAKNKPPCFDFQRTIIEKLRELKFDIYIVTASVAWAVEPAAALFGLAPESVIGIRTRIENGLVTDQQDGVITYREGKVAALLAATQGENATFASGNSEGDLALLESAKELRLVIASAPGGDSNFSTEQRMQEIAENRGWYRHSL